MKQVKDDVGAVVAHLKAVPGSTWGVASQLRAQTNSKLVNPPRSPRPWLAIAEMADSDDFEK
eukprot:6213560-Pleurochrysis_carterae.AAC.1